MSQDLARMSDTLCRDAEALLKKHALMKLLGEFGEVMPTGSFAGNLMTTGDIDLYVIGRWRKETVQMIFGKLVQEVDAKGWLLFNWIKYRDPRFPRAWYIGIKDVFRGRKWKIDIWFLTNAQVQALPFSTWGTVPMSNKQRDLILRFKHLRDRKQWDIPSYRVYEAVLEQGADSVKKIREYGSMFVS